MIFEMAKPKTLTIELGVFAPPLCNQLHTQGVEFDTGDMLADQAIADAINELYLNDYLSPSQLATCRDKLKKSIIRKYA